MAEEVKKDRALSVESLLQNASRTTSTDNKSLREILADEFKGTNLITIKNVLSHDFGWVYTDPEEEDVQQPDSATRRVFFGEPKARVLKAGETVTIQGWEGYIALTRMYKEMVQEGNNISVEMGSTMKMREFLSEAFLGKFNPNEVTGTKKAKTAEPEKAKAKVATDEDLGLE